MRVARAIGLEAADGIDRGLELAFELPNPDERGDPCHEFEAIDGLGEEVVGPGIDGSFDIANFIQCRHHDDGDVTEFSIRFDFFADLKAAHAGHHDVEDDDVGVDVGDALHGFEAVARGDDGARHVIEIGLKKFEVLFVVVDQKDGRGSGPEVGQEVGGFGSVMTHKDPSGNRTSVRRAIVYQGLYRVWDLTRGPRAERCGSGSASLFGSATKRGAMA